ncbi:hypothetical protein Taro_002654 [Colocasia esculenta]|uniref:Uncharacterized protein n=1 Tax=Colocasia esculenta TaxID=4460 RepID=A0A843TH45_COLES|nr:hypothetical protein [Colocasia esculenta]
MSGVLCQAPRVHTPSVNKYFGALLPRTGQGPIAQALYQVLERSPTLCRTSIFILWPQSFNDKLIVVSTLDQVVSTPYSKHKTKSGKTGQVVSTLDQVVSTPCSKHKTKLGKTGQVVSTLVQVVSTQCIKYKEKRSSSVDTRSSSVDTRDSFQKTP